MIIPLFLEDELTGIKIPNVGTPEEFIVVSDKGAEACFLSKNEALNWISKKPYNGTREIYHIPATKPVET